MRNSIRVFLTVTLFSSATVWADYAGYMQRGKAAFDAKKYDEAAEQFRLAETERPGSAEVAYNLGNSLFEKQDYDGAIQAFQRVIDGLDPRLHQQGYYNLGNAQFRKESWPDAIKSYEEAIKRDPNDVDAKFNLELARKMLKENSKADNQQQQQQDQQKQDQQQQDQQQQDQQQQDQQKQDQQKQDQQQQDQQKQDQQKQQNQQKPDQQEQQKNDVGPGKKMSKEDAERLLNSMKQSEKEAQDKLRKMRARASGNGKDW
jgi:tetratricopeptide (TPR) repeat protein